MCARLTRYEGSPPDAIEAGLAPLGFRITEDDRTLCYIPDHAPALAGPLGTLDSTWISGDELAREADLLLHGCQYTDAEYPGRVGWGHSGISDALHFVRRTELDPTG